MDCIICRYGELALKGKNRHMFEQRLVDNIRDCLEKNSIDGDIKKVRGRIFVFTSDQDAIKSLRDVFGLTSISPSVVSTAEPEMIRDEVVKYVRNTVDVSRKITFRITTKRTDKDFPKTSNETDIMLGDAIANEFGFDVNLKNHDLNVGVEIHNKAFIFHEKLPCHGGLPLGITGKVACLIEDDAGAAAAWLMMKRGCNILALARKKIDIGYLSKYSYGSEIQLKTITDIEKADQVMTDNDCKALVVGETLESFDPAAYSSIERPVLTPIIAYTEEQITGLVEKIR